MKEKRSLRTALTSAFAVGMTSRLLMQVFALSQIMMASRFISLAEFGAYALAWAVTAIFHGFIFTGYYQAFLRSKLPDQDRNTVFTTMFGIGAVASILLISIGALVGDAEPLTSKLFLALAILPMIEALCAWNDVHLLRDARMRTTSWIGAASEAVASLVIAVALWRDFGAMALVLSRYSATITIAVLSSICVRRLPRFDLNFAVLRQERHTAISLWISTGANMLANYGIDIVLGVFLNPAQVGVYRGGARISQTAADLVQQPLSILTWSRFSRLHEQGRRRQIPYVWRMNMAFGTSVAWPLMISVALLSEELVLVILDESWLPAATVVAILSIVRAIRILPSQLDATLTSYDRQYLQLKIRLFGVTLTVLGVLVFGRHSAESAAAVQIVTAALMAVLTFWVTHRIMSVKVGPLVLTFLPAIFLTTLCGLFITITEPLRNALSPEFGLFLTLLGLLALWSGGLILALVRRKLRWPVP